MSESKYGEAHRAGYILGFGDGRHEGLEKARDAFWRGFCVALATWPLAVVAYVAWRVF